MKPSFLFISNGYPPAIEFFEKKEKEEKCYREHKKELSQNLLDIASLYALSVSDMGYPAKAVLHNYEAIQKKWARENGANFSEFSPPHLAQKSQIIRSVISRLPKFYYFFRSHIERSTWFWQILISQIKKDRPDIIQIFDLHYFTPSFLREAKKYANKIIGEISSPIMLPKENLKCYDLLLSSLPHYVEQFRDMGIESRYMPYAFESSIIERIREQERRYDCVFIGGLSGELERTKFLEKVAENIDVDFWGEMNPPLDKSSPIMANYHGSVWGIDMFKVFAQSKIVINRHTTKLGSVFSNEKYANNMRLYESTGMGAMLITDAKENLGDLFEVGKEVETYRTLEELVEKVEYYLCHDQEREEIASAGQKKTLRDHTYKVRAKQLLEIIK